MHTVTHRTIEQAIDDARLKLAATEILWERDHTRTLRLRVRQQRRTLGALQESLCSRSRTLQ
jgi:hypothetical protein